MTPREAFSALVRRPVVPLGEGCFVIAECLGHVTSVASGLQGLDALAELVDEAIGADLDERTVESVAAQLCGPLGFRGDPTRYYDLRNSMLAEVLERRRGIPITLAIVVIEVCGRLGATATGVGMPGHFLVGDGVRPTRWLDPFDGGSWLDAFGAAARFHAIHGPEATFDPSFLEPTPNPQILGRVLANLAGIYRSQGDPTGLLRVLELRCDIPGVGVAPRPQVELAEAYVTVGRLEDAIRVLTALTERVDPRRRDVLLERIAMLQAARN